MILLKFFSSHIKTLTCSQHQLSLLSWIMNNLTNLFVFNCSFKCHSLLNMAMFRHKHKTALKYAKTLYDHFRASVSAALTQHLTKCHRLSIVLLIMCGSFSEPCSENPQSLCPNAKVSPSVFILYTLHCFHRYSILKRPRLYQTIPSGCRTPRRRCPACRLRPSHQTAAVAAGCRQTPSAAATAAACHFLWPFSRRRSPTSISPCYSSALMKHGTMRRRWHSAAVVNMD